MDNIIFVIISILSLLVSFISIYFSLKIYKKYELNMKKLGEGKDFAEMLKSYVSQVEEVNKRDDQIIEFCNRLNNELAKCIKKVGLYKYNAFGNTKNDLSFTLALLDRNNSGIVINSIYGQDNSNVYTKSVFDGKSKSKLSEEEQMAINIAMIDNKNTKKKEKVEE